MMTLRRSLVALSLLALAACGQADGERVTDLPNGDATRGAMVTGVVTDTEGRPSEGAVVSLEAVVDGLPASVARELPGMEPQLARAGADFATTTDAQGRYRLPGVTAGEWQLEARAANHLGQLARFELQPQAVAAGDTIIVDVALTPVASYTGVATLENATSHQATLVYVEGSSHVAATDPAGGWRIDGVPLGSHDLRASHIGYLDRTYQGQLTAAGQVEDLGGVVLPLDANIAPVADAGGPYTGFALDPTAFSGGGSDLDGSVVYYEWDFEDDGVWDYADSTTGNTTHEYPTAGNYLAKLRVTDDKGATALDAAQVTIDLAGIYLAEDGNDGNAGTDADPVATLATALQLASSQQLVKVFAAEGNYAGSGTTSLVDGISILGGRDRNDWSETASGVSRFFGTGRELFGNGITSDTTIRRVVVDQTATPATGTSSAVRLASCSGNLRFEQCSFIASAGRDGAGGGNGPNGSPGGNGGSGFPGSCDGPRGGGGSGGFSPTGCGGGAGGPGGVEGPNAGQPGSSGLCSGGSGGNGGSGGDPGLAGQNGGNGAPGFTGGGGGVNNSGGSFQPQGWVPLNSFAGSNGGVGRGGGGGGGGGGQGCTFCDNGGGNGGGGGGGGGGFGQAGSGGQGGWGSFAVLAISSSSVFVDCSFTTAGGGDGGRGGDGGTGGAGGSGGSGATACTAEIGRGGNGGNGGNGGGGGGGGGGPGGPSWGVYRIGPAPSVVNGTFNIGPGGAGGAGGLAGGVGPAAQSGPAGTSGNVN